MFIGNDLYRVYRNDNIIAVLSTAAQVEAFGASLQYSHDMTTIRVMQGAMEYKLKSLFNTLTDKEG